MLPRTFLRSLNQINRSIFRSTTIHSQFTYQQNRTYVSTSPRQNTLSKRPLPSRKPTQRPTKNRTLSYEELVSMRRDQASRSVLIQVPGRQNCDYVYKYCQRYGNISAAFYESHVKDYMLVEFDTESAALGMSSSADHFEKQNIPVESRVLYLVSREEKRETGILQAPVVFDGPREVKMSELYNAGSISEQLSIYHNAERLTELETRLRYFLCSLLEDVLTPMFPLVEISPYGSSANRLGRHGSDLDMVLNLNNPENRLRPSSPFRYMTKVIDDERQFTQRTLRVIGEILQLFVPHVSQVQKIVHARVPIINFFHEATATYCDISLGNNSVVQMSKILYMIGESEPRFRPLIFALRKWASLNDLTLDKPGPRFSNFMLTMMVVAFLQIRDKPVLAPMSQYLRDDWTYSVQGSDNCDSEELLLEFFDFYSDFDFETNGLSLLDGKLVEKEPLCALYIENPMETGHNCAQNVHQKELGYLKACIRSSRDRLLESRHKSEQNWGLLSLLSSRHLGSDVNIGVNVRNLF